MEARYWQLRRKGERSPAERDELNVLRAALNGPDGTGQRVTVQCEELVSVSYNQVLA